tara:strand:- start:170 stop:730 length:561 start_codon:yes stop_codon:yes gene_type:complete
MDLNSLMFRCLFLMLYLLFSTSLSAEELFNMRLYDDSKSYLSKKLIDKYKKKHSETRSGFFQINISKLISNKNKSPYFQKYTLIIDDNDLVHGITGIQKYNTVKECLKISDQISPYIEKQFNIVFSNEGEFQTPNMVINKKEVVLNSGSRLNINCNFYTKQNYSMMWLFLDSRALTVAINNFYKKF